MKTLVLKIDVDTLRGTQEGVPRLASLLNSMGAEATFLFSLGPDHTGRAIKRIFRKGFLKKVQRTSVLQHYGLKTLLYGTLIPGPHIGRRASSVMKQTADLGFEVGIHTWDHIAWQDGVRMAPPGWTVTQMELAEDRFREIFGVAPTIHGAAGWQMNETALRHLDETGYQFSSDTRGTRPFLPVVEGISLRTPQLPTTLPTLDELIGRDGINHVNVASHLLNLTETCPESGHVFTLHAELEGMQLLNVLKSLLSGWQQQGYQLLSLSKRGRMLQIDQLPHCELVWGSVPGRSGSLMCQGEAISQHES